MGINSHPLYGRWKAMRHRCGIPTHRDYPNYGGRGIYVCKEWESFHQFASDMGDCPAGYTIERIDNDGPYSPENCKWIPKSEQTANRRPYGNANLIEAFGESRPLKQWATLKGIDPETLRGRLRRGWPAEKALSTSAVGKHRKH